MLSDKSHEEKPSKPKVPLNSRRQSPTNRDKPQLAAPRQPQRRDFYTESLNASYIPSPSPTRSPAPANLGGRPRQVLRNNRTSAAGSKVAVNDKASLGSPTFSSRQRAQHSSQRYRPEQARLRGSPCRTPHKLRGERAVTRTPSPSRGRKQETAVSPASTASASSPPRGLAEAYQRIEDEESLAGQEDDSVDDLGYEDPHFLVDDIGEGEQRHERTGSPHPRVSQKQVLREISGYDTKLEEGQFDTGDISKSSSGSSSMQFVPNTEDDTFNQVFSRHARDERRIRDALRDDAQPFRKARTREKASLTAENLQRKDASSRSDSRILKSPSNASSKDSDPSLNIPREWGRKGRNEKLWLNRLGDKNAKPDTGDITGPSVAHADDIDLQDSKEVSNLTATWVAAAGTDPLPSIENGMQTGESSSRNTTPIPQIRQSSSIDKLRKWEPADDDFTARSLRTSDSPPIRIRNAALDLFRQREIQSLERSAVTTNRLGELKEKRSVEHLRRRSPSISSDIAIEERLKELPRSTSKSSLQPPFEEEEDAASQNLQKEPLLEDRNGDPLTSFPEVVISIKKDSLETVGNTEPNGNGANGFQRPVGKRGDSHDLLRRLSRAASDSPNTSNTHKKWFDESKVGKKEIDMGKPPVATAGTPSKHIEKPTNLIKGVETKDLNESTSHNTHQKSSLLPLKDTPLRQKENVPPKTPVVTGAWLDTPFPTIKKVSLILSPTDMADKKDLNLTVDSQQKVARSEDPINGATQEDEPDTWDCPSLAKTAPVLPKSALSAILEKAKEKKKRLSEEDNEDMNDDTFQIDDSTIQLLEDIVATDADFSRPLTLPRSVIPPITESHNQPMESSIATASIPLEDLQPHNQLTSRLNRLSISIRDAKTGISSLERAVANVPTQSPATAVASKKNECTEAGEFHDFIWPCERCGCPGSRDGGSDSWQTVKISLPRLWTWRRGDRWPQLTWLAIITIVVWALVIGEIIA